MFFPRLSHPPRLVGRSKLFESHSVLLTIDMCHNDLPALEELRASQLADDLILIIRILNQEHARVLLEQCRCFSTVERCYRYTK